MAKARESGTLAIDEIWQSVALEERLELISKSQASGFLASVVTLALVGCIAYGLDEIWLLAAAVSSGFFAFPLFSSYTWRTGKPSLILAYLAVRTVARRYAYGFDLPNIDIILIYKAEMKFLYGDTEEKELNRQNQSVDFDSTPIEYTPVWVVLMRSGVLLLSEKKGGAKLQYMTPILSDTKLENTEEDVGYNELGCLIEGSAQSKGKNILLKSRYKGAHYVFTKKLEQLIFESIKAQETMENLRKKAI